MGGPEFVHSRKLHCRSGFTREHRRSRCHTPRCILRGHARSHMTTTALKAATVPVGAGSPANTGAAGAIHRVAFFAGKPAPTGSPQPSTQPQYLWERACPRTPAQPVPYTALHSSRVNPLPQAHHSLQRSRSTCGGMPANTGTAGAIHRVAFFAGKPAPTGSPQPSTQPQYLWERACPRTPAQPVQCTALDSSRARPLPQDHHSLQGSRSTCGSGFTREHRRSRCHTPSCILHR